MLACRAACTMPAVLYQVIPSTTTSRQILHPRIPSDTYQEDAACIVRL